MKNLAQILAVFIVFALNTLNLSANAQNFAKNDENLSAQNFVKIDALLAKNAKIDAEIKDNILFIRYSNFNAFLNTQNEAKKLEKKIKSLSKNDENLAELNRRFFAIKKQLEILKEFEISPFTTMIEPAIIPDTNINGVIEAISGFSLIKKLNSQLDDYSARVSSLENLITKFEEKEQIFMQVCKLSQNDQNSQKLDEIRRYLSEFRSAYDLMTSSKSVYERQINDSINLVKSNIAKELKSTFNVVLTICVVSLVSFLIKFGVKKYIVQMDKVYSVNKFINFINVTLIILILLFAYIENFSYVITLLGFVSAGLAIAMKDMFMSMLGWGVIMVGGSYHVGDRIKVRKDGENIVGDIIDISILRITLFEDITLETYKNNRRAGRIIFVPNNYIFTDMMANYTHYGMKTIWDGIDVVISFDSNHQKAINLIKNIARKYSKGYTDIAKIQMNALRAQYSIKNPNVEPRIFSFFEPYGISISVWYMANAYTLLTLRSKISFEIIEELKKQSDIRIAYPTQSLYFEKKYPFDFTSPPVESAE